MRRLPAVQVLLALFLVLTPSGALAAWPHYPAAGGLMLSPAGGSAAGPISVADGSGGFFVAWYEFRSGSYDIYAQHVNVSGMPMWTANGVAVCAAAGQQYYPSITPDGAGGVFVAWSDYRGGTNSDVYAQRLDASGAPLWTANGVAVCAAANDQANVVLAADGWGGVALAWMDYRTPANGYDIYGEHLSSGGTPIWGAGSGIPIAVVANQQASVQIGYVGGSVQAAYVAWDDARGANSDIYIQRINYGGGLSFAVNGLAVCNAAGDQYAPALAIDPIGGTAYVAWEDNRGATTDIYAQRVNAGGGMLWAANGTLVCGAGNPQNTVAAAADDHGGLLLAWQDLRSGNYDIYAQHLDANGAKLWTSPDGLPMCAAAADQYWPRITSDGLGGALVAWSDTRFTSYDVYAQRASAAGAVMWTANGVAVCTVPGNKLSVTLASDGAGAGYITWWDSHVGNGSQVYAGRLDEWGILGAEPVTRGVKDVPNDNGGHVKLSWDASPLDTDPAYRSVTDYLVLRSAPPLAVQAALRANRVAEAGAIAAGGGATPDGRLVATRTGAQTYYWEQVGTVPAIHTAGYSYIALTTGDSLGAGNPKTLFAVMARNTSLGQFWTSSPDSGYSVDNIAPFTPAPFAAQYAAGTARLHWNPNPDADLANYVLYRGTSTSFVPGPASLVASPADTGYTDVAGAPYVYKLVAVDIHGNVSPPAVVTPSGTLGVPAQGPLALEFAAPSPNPLRAGVNGTVRFTVPAPGRITLALYDGAGRRALTIADGVREAGSYSVNFDGRAAGGRPLAPGLYFLRLECAAGTRTARLAVVE